MHAEGRLLYRSPVFVVWGHSRPKRIPPPPVRYPPWALADLTMLFRRCIIIPTIIGFGSEESFRHRHHWSPSGTSRPPPGPFHCLAVCPPTTTAGYSRYPQTCPRPVYCSLNPSSRASEEALSMAQTTLTSRFLPALLRSPRHSIRNILSHQR